MPHIGDELLNRRDPAVADLNPSPSPLRVRRIVRFCASPDHIVPNVPRPQPRTHLALAVISSGRHDGFASAPSHLQPCEYKGFGEARFASPIRENLSLTIAFDIPIVAFILRLFFIGSPMAILGFVRARLGLSDQACSRAGEAPYIEETLSRIPPPITDRNSKTTKAS